MTGFTVTPLNQATRGRTQKVENAVFSNLMGKCYSLGQLLAVISEMSSTANPPFAADPSKDNVKSVPSSMGT